MITVQTDDTVPLFFLVLFTSVQPPQSTQPECWRLWAYAGHTTTIVSDSRLLVAPPTFAHRAPAPGSDAGRTKLKSMPTLRADDTLRMSFTRRAAITADQCDTGWVIINMLPEDALLAIFGCYLDGSDSKATSMMNLKNGCVESGHTLVHVCQKWRKRCLRSPHRLNMQLHCAPGTLVKRMLDVWPTLPIIMHHFGLTFKLLQYGRPIPTRNGPHVTACNK